MSGEQGVPGMTVPQVAMKAVVAIDNAFERSERLRLGQWVAPDERRQTIAAIITEHFLVYFPHLASRRDEGAMPREKVDRLINTVLLAYGIKNAHLTEAIADALTARRADSGGPTGEVGIWFNRAADLRVALEDLVAASRGVLGAADERCACPAGEFTDQGDDAPLARLVAVTTAAQRVLQSSSAVPANGKYCGAPPEKCCHMPFDCTWGAEQGDEPRGAASGAGEPGPGRPAADLPHDPDFTTRQDAAALTQGAGERAGVEAFQKLAAEAAENPDSNFYDGVRHALRALTPPAGPQGSTA